MSLPISDFLAVWGLLAVNIAAPGPNVLNTIATAMGSGRSAGLGSALGVGFGIGGWCLAMGLGVSAVFALVPATKLALTAVAVGLLALFSWRYLRAARAGLRGTSSKYVERRGGLTVSAAFLRSLAVNALNPKALTTWLAVVSIFPVARASGADITLLCLGACCLSLCIHSLYALAFSTPAAARFYLRAAPWINLGVAVFFALFAAALARAALT